MSNCDFGTYPCYCSDCREMDARCEAERAAGYPCRKCRRPQIDDVPPGEIVPNVCEACYRALACSTCGKPVGEPLDGCRLRHDGALGQEENFCCACAHASLRKWEEERAAATKLKREAMLARRQPCPACSQPRILPWAGAVCARCFREGRRAA